MIKIAVTLALIISAFSAISGTSTLRCGKQLVKLGDTKAEVKIVCGEPIDIDLVEHTLDDKAIVKTEIYTYYFGKGKLIKILKFENGKLAAIDEGRRVN
ncbi:DUF2845 domain-containing protein [Agaribacter flavus]|uniref:DUF2845 domain-containing protein n=1 Tax=Agaribacter flavus TaxID=1902781 RepID=A0ABV7FT63_9ALTE